ncbi:energy-coupling factor transporter transmembrane component T [Tissierella sp. MB52-C2]|uniref:energy-coupling factor transporter transmembrane component T n=1 Tax=Tissierella sp. MB52-C2 TaxID=3070999 RepID=UPI00280A94B3|nr:energy-coupling factor transporter transmembrane component T [Tissierella sp. MB52-C2]WMM25164.1 energy-coupling factor transporter transmembrane component T [Tissierella sp. MB52-C2]
MIKDNYFIDKMNPFLKIIILIIITLIGSLDFMPFASTVLIVSGFIIASLFSSLSFKELANSVKTFIIMSVGFMTVISITRLLSQQDLQLLTVIGLGFRIILISVYSSIFVKTTDPSEFVMVLIKYFKISARFGYAFLTAYRFLPTFKQEMEIIKHAHQVRGVSESKNPLVKIWESQRYIIPMMATAVRKGIRISMAMETRAFGKSETRTYYRKVIMNRKEIIISAMYIIYIMAIVLLLYFNGLTKFNLIYVD